MQKKIAAIKNSSVKFWLFIHWFKKLLLSPYNVLCTMYGTKNKQEAAG